MKDAIKEWLEAIISIVVVTMVIYLATLTVSVAWHYGSALIALRSDLKVMNRCQEILNGKNL